MYTWWRVPKNSKKWSQHLVGLAGIWRTTTSILRLSCGGKHVGMSLDFVFFEVWRIPSSKQEQKLYYIISWWKNNISFVSTIQFVIIWYIIFIKMFHIKYYRLFFNKKILIWIFYVLMIKWIFICCKWD